MEKPNGMKSGVKDGGDGDFLSCREKNGERSSKLFETDLLKIYLDTLSKKEYASYLIAKSHLGTSFQLEKSNGYLQWKIKYTNSL